VSLLVPRLLLSPTTAAAVVTTAVVMTATTGQRRPHANTAYHEGQAGSSFPW
jgi:hypothetical protein